MRQYRSVGTIALFAAVLGAACSEPSAPVRSTSPARLSTVANVSLVECTLSEPQSTKATVGPGGATLTLGGASVTVPAGAVLQPVELTLSVPVAPWAMVDVTATGYEHFVFEQPISVSLTYERCSAGRIERAPLSVWYVDAAGTLLEQMPTLDDRNRKRVTFLTGHLSGYAIAN